MYSKQSLTCQMLMYYYKLLTLFVALIDNLLGMYGYIRSV